MTIQPGEWMSAGPIGGPIPSNPVPTVNPGQAMRLSLDYEVGPGACIGCAKQGELGLEGESEILDCAFDRVAAIDVSGVAILEFSAPLEPGSYYVVANYAERFLCGGLMMDANYREWYGGAPTAGTQRVAGFCVRP